MDILIVGGGKVGSHLASILHANSHQVTLIERNEQIVGRLKLELREVKIIHGDGCNPPTLSEAGIRRVQAVVATTGDDEDNLVIAKLAKYEYRVGRVIARINNPKNEWLFTKRMGVDIAVSHAALLASLIQEELTIGDLVPLLKLAGGEVSLTELTVPATSRVIDQPIVKIELPPECVLVTVLRDGNLIIPRGDTTLAGGDRIIALVRSDQQAKLVSIFN